MLFRAYYAIYQDESKRADQLTGELETVRKSLEPRLEIVDDADSWLFEEGRCQVQVRNCTDGTLRFRGQLTDITPAPEAPDLRLPVHLQIAGEREGVSEGVLLGRQNGSIEVFTLKSDPSGNKVLCIYGATNPIIVDRLPYRVAITVQADPGKSISRTFMLFGHDSDRLSLFALPADDAEPTSPANVRAPAIPSGRVQRRTGRRLCLLALMLFNRLWRAFFGRKRAGRRAL